MLPKTDAFAGAHVVTIKMRFAFQSILSPTLQVYLPDFFPGQPLQSNHHPSAAEMILASFAIHGDRRVFRLLG